jgi:hypothetical protein
MAASQKTLPTSEDPERFIAAVEDDARREDARTLSGLLEEWTGEPPVMWGTSIVGFGSFHYRYESGREGDAYRVSIAERKHGLSLYVLAMTEDGRYLAESRADRFPKASIGKSCVRFKRLDDLDEGELRALLAEAGRLPAPGAV